MSIGCNLYPVGGCSEAEGLSKTANGTASHAVGTIQPRGLILLIGCAKVAAN
jgi:hypothetical protein